MRERLGSRWRSAPTTGGSQLPTGSWSFSYDEGRDEVIAFGFDTFPAVASTWRWNSAGWFQLSPATTATARQAGSMVYDRARQRIVLHGGSVPSTGLPLSDTWEWDGTDWTQATPATVPTGARVGVRLAYDDFNQRVVLFTNDFDSNNDPLCEQWLYDGVDWTAQPPLPNPLRSRWCGPAVYDRQRSELLVLGSADHNLRYGETWIFDGTSWMQGASVGAAPTPFIENTTVTNDPAGSGLIVFGGTDPWALRDLDALWRWDGVDWQLLASGAIPERSAASMWTQNSSVYVYGGVRAQSPQVADTWRWDGLAWTQVVTANAPSATSGTSVAFHAGAGHALLFGGTDTNVVLDGTWTFQGNSWLQRQPTTVPPARTDASAAYDPVRNRVVMFGGMSSSQPSLPDTWERDGSDWTRVVTVNVPGNPVPRAMAYDVPSQRIVLSCYGDNSQQLWAYDGQDWQLLDVAGGDGRDPLQASTVAAATGPSGRATFVTAFGLRELIEQPAEVATLDQSCPTPLLAATHLPTPGETALAIEVSEAPPGAPVAVVGADAPASVPLLGCVLLVTPGQATALALAGTTGVATLPLPIPNNPALLGARFWFQGATTNAFVPSGVLLGPALVLTIGS